MINGKSIDLTAIIPGDFQALFRWMNDVDAARLNDAYRPVDWASHHEWWSNIGKDQTKVMFAIRKRDPSSIVGYVQIFNISGVHRSANFGIRVGDAADRGQGYGTEAIGLALAYCWNDLNLSRIALTVLETNRGAIKLYDALGFKREGVLRRALFIDGRWVDAVLMALHHPSREDDRTAARPVRETGLSP